MRRRDLLPLLAALAAARPLAAAALRAKNPVLGVLAPSTPERLAALLKAWHKALGDAGFIEGRTLAVEYRYAEGDFGRFPALAADLAARHVDVIWCGPVQAAVAAKKATAIIPIVFSYVPDPIAAGLVKSFNRPEGNITGISSDPEGLDAKRLQLLRELVPAATRIGYLVAEKDMSRNSYWRGEQDRVAAAGKTLGVGVVFLTATKPDEIEPALAGAKQMGIGAIVVQAHGFFAAETKRLVNLLAHYALPAARTGDFAMQGGLLSYGADQEDIAYKAGAYVARILKGAKPTELPVMQPTKFTLAINMRTAKALGLTVPPALLALADEIIE